MQQPDIRVEPLRDNGTDVSAKLMDLVNEPVCWCQVLLEFERSDAHCYEDTRAA